MVDNKLYDVVSLLPAVYRDLGLSWFFQGDNIEYFADEYLLLNPHHINEYNEMADGVYRAMIRTLKRVNEDNLWGRMHIPEFCVPLIKYSLTYELDDHLIGRFDFAGGLDEAPIKLIEFNADSCSLMPETAYVQEALFEQEQESINGEPEVILKDQLIQSFQEILKRNADFEPNLLLSTSGHPEDKLNVKVIGQAAKKAGFAEVDYLKLSKVVFSEEEGIFSDLGNGDYKQYDYWFKQMPWDLFAIEEPDLWKILEVIVTNGLAKVLNPAYTMILQNKAFLSILYESNPQLKSLLKTSGTAVAFMNEAHFKKPIFGRMGENISVYNRNHQKIYSTGGGYAKSPMAFQEAAAMDRDNYGYRYQPSLFWSGGPAGLCFRRQAASVVNDDAEYVPHYVREIDAKDFV